MKNLFVLLILFLLIIFIIGCHQGSNKILPVTETANNTTDDNDPPSEEQQEEMIHGMDLHDYPNPKMVPDYETMNVDQKAAFDLLGEAAVDIIQNGLQQEKKYTLDRRISWSDYTTATSIFFANFTALDFLGSLEWHDTIGTTQYADYLVIVRADDYRMKDFVQNEYPAICQKADEILLSLDHDGTEYGKAFAIAKWLADNTEYELYNTSIYNTLFEHKAQCIGYSFTYDFLCKRAGLKTIFVTGETILSDHAWNMIYTNNHWYHIDVTWMNPDTNEYYRYFMMPDKICFDIGYLYTDYYVPAGSTRTAPIADSFDLYKSYHGSCKETIAYFENIEINAELKYEVAFENNIEMELFMDHKGNIIIDKTKRSYMLSIINIFGSICLVTFVEV